MIHRKECPKGIDVHIQKLQEDLYCYLCHDEVWKLHESEYDSYGRAYRNRNDRGYLPEFYKGNGEYCDLLLNDKTTVLSFFDVSGQVTASNAKSETADVHLVFFVNLVKLKRTKHRADAEVRLDVREYLRLQLYGFNLVSEVTGVERVLEEYTGRREEELLQFDLGRWHCFRFNLRCTYDPTTIIN